MSALGARERLIVALDVPAGAEALALVERVGNLVEWFKVGLELYLAEGNGIVEKVRERGHSVFLDLKLHDIPNTVAGAIRSVAGSGAEMLTVHAAGGPAMLMAAREAAAAMPSAPKLLAVTVLTSMDAAQLAATGVSETPGEQVLRLAEIAHAAGIDRLVASSKEIARLRAAYPNSMLVIPGIRPAGSTAGDQKRVATPGSAIADGADFLVVGRPITHAADPAAAAQAILDEMEAVIRPAQSFRA
ncbi:MAG: orotidine-5'-phosphate decarboxylase [Acidobacteriaceae bacterium]|nr:orotidine-5'-phosphate decarboxylase [Acidobacteriaceae bacterium]